MAQPPTDLIRRTSLWLNCGRALRLAAAIAVLRRYWILPILVSVTLTFFSFPPFPLGAVMLVGLVPLFWVLDEAPSARAAFWRCWTYVFLGNCAICYWVAHTLSVFGGLPAFLSWPCVALLSVTEQLAWPITAYLRHRVHARWRPFLWTPACLVTWEVVLPKLFPDTMGYVFYRLPWLSQLADIGGIWGLTALVVLSNETIARVLRVGWRESRREWVPALALGLAVCAYSTARLVQVRRWMGKPIGEMRTALVQPNVNPIADVRNTFFTDQARVEAAYPIFEQSYQLVGRAPELVFWPETAIANTYHGDNPDETRALTDAVDRFSLTTRLPLLFGAREMTGGRLYNTLYLLTQSGNGRETQRYHKVRLLWLGEWIPFADRFPGFARWIGERGGVAFTAGPGPQVFTLGKLRLGPLICLEGLYPGYVRDVANQGVDLLVNATNDAWYGPGTEPALHLYLTAFRAIETRRPILRATTTGYSALVDIDGTLRAQSRLGRRETLLEAAPIYPDHPTVYRLYGPYLLALTVLWAVLGGLLPWLSSRQRPVRS